MGRPLRYGDAMDRPGLSVMVRFLSKVKANRTGCWIWKGCASGRSGGLYGRIKVGGKPLWTHRVSYAIFNGGVPDGLDVHHTCENTLCVNPAHLEAITRSENTAEGNERRSVPF